MDNGIPLDNSLQLQRQVESVSRNDIFARDADFVAILTIFFILDALVVVHFLNCFIDDCKHVLLELRSCRCGILTIFFILNALVGDRQWHSF
jgi:hypothetical protein